MKKTAVFKRMAAGIIGSVLSLGFAGGVIPSAAPVIAAENAFEFPDNYNMDTGMYEYEFHDALVYRVEANIGDITIQLLPSRGGNFFSYNDMKVIHLSSFSRSRYIEWAERYEEENYQLALELMPQSRVNISFAALNEYDDITTPLGYMGGPHDNEYNEYYVSRILSITDPNEHIYGDINDDKVIDSFDVITYQKYIAGNLSENLTSDQFLNADIDMDTEITKDDMQQVRDFVLGSTKEFNVASNIGSIRLDDTVTVEASEGRKIDDDFAKAEMKFGVDLLKKCYEDEGEKKGNLLLSPLSISSALSMTANGADGETFDEMEKVLGDGLSVDDINNYMAKYISSLPDEKKEKVYLADSIWFKDNPTLKVYDEFLETNKKYYNAEIYKSPFDLSTVKDINSWVNKNTKGMIPTLLKEDGIKGNTMMMLINTLYFESEWASPYTSSTEGVFTDLEGGVHNIKCLNSKEYQYFDLGNADAFKKPYANENYSFVGILPHEDVDFDSFIQELDGKALVDGLKEYEDPDTLDLFVMIPKFKYNYDKSLKEILPLLGMEKAFSPDAADFSKMNDLSVEGALPLYIDNVLHKTKIEVTERGTKAAAVTSVSMGAGAGMPVEKKTIHIDLDRPFVYMIVDRNNVPLFIGAATQLEQK